MEKRRFRFLKKLSEGTFGKVYLAEIITDSKFSKVVAKLAARESGQITMKLSSVLEMKHAFLEDCNIGISSK